MSGSKRRHVFISHHHKDDEHVTRLTDLLSRKGYDIRNSSIRAKPENQRRIDENRVKDETIRRLLRMKMSWAGSAVVLIGSNTHERKWVNWEIEQAHKKGKRIIGVYARGEAGSELPDSFRKYGDDLIPWEGEKIIAAIDGAAPRWENPDGTSYPSRDIPRETC